MSALAQDQNGLLLIGSGSGLFYYDGENIERDDFVDLKEALILTIYVDNNNTIYVGTSDGFFVLPVEGKPIKFDSLNGVSFSVFSFTELPNEIILGTSIGFLSYENGKLIHKRELAFFNDKRPYQYVKFNGREYVLSREGFYVKIKKENKWKRLVNSMAFFFSKNNSGEAILAAKDGIYSVNKDSTILIFDEIYSYDRIHPVAHLKSTDEFLINVDNDIVFFKNGKITRKVYITEFLPDGPIFVDKDEILWVSSYTEGGLLKYYDLNIQLFERHYGVKSNPFGFCQRKNGEILVGTDGEGILKYNGYGFETFDETFPYKFVTAIYEDSFGKLWVLSPDGLIYYDKKGRKHKVQKKNNSPWNFLGDAYEAEDGSVWFTSYEKLYRYKNGKIDSIYNPQLKNTYFYEILGAENGEMWVIGDKGLRKFDSSGFINFKFQDKLSSNQFYAIEKTHDGKLILGSAFHGLFIFDPHARDTNAALVNISEKEGLINNTVYEVLVDDKENLWIMTAYGLSIIDYNVFLNENKLKFVNFGQGDPAIGDEYNQASSLLDNEGRIWLGGTRGILRIDNPHSFLAHKYLLRPYVKEIHIILNGEDNKVFRKSRLGLPVRSFKLKHFENNVFLKFGTISFTNRNFLEYRYDIFGKRYNQKFAWKRNAEIFLVNLASDQYKINLEVRDQYSDRQKAPQILSFDISLPFWKTPQFFFLIVMTIGVVVILIVVYREKSLRKRNEELSMLVKEKEEIANELRKTSTEYQELFDNAFSPMLILNIDELIVIDANIAACKLFQYSLQEFRKVNFEELFNISRNEFLEHLKQFKKTKTSYYNFLALMKTNAGKILEVEVNAKVIEYKNQNAAILVIRDITSEKEAEKNLRESLEHLEKSKELRHNFLAQMSHEIRTPLTSIVNFTALLKESIEQTLSPEAEMAIGSIIRSSHRIFRTVELMLNKSDLEAGSYIKSVEKFDLIELLQSVLSEYEQLAEMKGDQLKFEHDEDEIMMIADRYSVLQIFTNLVDNAVKYTKNGTVTVKVKKENGKIIVEVIDTGIGIQKEFLPFLFDAFTQEDVGYTRKFDGNGLGLSVVKSFCDLNNCEIEVESEKGKGSVFRVIFTT